MNSLKNRIKLRQGDVGEKMLVILTDSHEKLENISNLVMKFEGNVRNGDYVEGIANPYNDSSTKFIYQFKSEDVSVTGAYKRAFIRIYDESGNKISSEEISVEVLSDADISSDQAKIYVSKLDNLIEEFDHDFDEFMEKKEVDYLDLDKKNEELDFELSELKKGTTEIKSTQNDILQSIEDNELATKTDLETVKQESSANVVYQVIGKERIRIKITSDFSEKIRESLIENPNVAKLGAAETLVQPSKITYEVQQSWYDDISVLDKRTKPAQTDVNGRLGMWVLNYDLIDIIERELGDTFFASQGALSVEQKISVLKKICINSTYNVFGNGSGPSGTKLNAARYAYGILNDWIDKRSHTSAEISKLSFTSVYINDKVDSEGVTSIAVYSDPSDGVTKSIANIDYANIELELEISANEHIKSMIAANHVQNLATQTEAEAGTDNSKSMTPLGTAQQIEKKAVTVASNQTIGGIKNFKDGLMVNGDNIVGINDRSLLSISPTNVSIFADGSGTFIKHGAMVIVQGSVKFKQAVSYGSLITNALPTEFSATFNNGIIVGHSTSNSAKSMYVERGTTNIKANSNFDANEWFTFNGIYWTGEGE